MTRNLTDRRGARPIGLVLATLLLAALLRSTWGQAAPVIPQRLAVRVRAVDEANRPVTGAVVRTEYILSAERQENHEGYVNAAGYFESTGPALSMMSLEARRDDWYRSLGDVPVFRFASPAQAGATDVVAVLRPIRQPQAMYARKVDTYIPVDNQPVGFDLKRGRWVFPYQDGTVPDLLFRVSRTGRDRSSYGAVLELSFAGPGNGIQGVPPQGTGAWTRCAYAWPYEAPADGYQTSCVWRLSGGNEEGSASGVGAHEDLQIIRVRADADVEGNVARAAYGRLAHVEFGGITGPQMWLKFTYWLNPNETRNIEFDRQRNLFQNLAADEQVNEY